jgi:hypothetical protein
MATRGREVVYDFQYGERYGCDLLAARDLALAREQPGLYAWYLRLQPHATSPDAIRAYIRLFTSKRLYVTAAGVLNESYEGSLERLPFDPASGEIPASMLAAATVMFSPPIYLGISKNVRTRLQQHLDALEGALREVEPMPMPAPQIEPDTFEESATFGQRAAALLKASRINDVSGLFVKVLYDGSIERRQLIGIEHLINRAFVPVCGRR